jgi:hypothetical protein
LNDVTGFDCFLGCQNSSIEPALKKRVDVRRMHHFAVMPQFQVKPRDIVVLNVDIIAAMSANAQHAPWPKHNRLG